MKRIATLVTAASAASLMLFSSTARADEDRPDRDGYGYGKQVHGEDRREERGDDFRGEEFRPDQLRHEELRHDGWREHEWRDHEWREHEWREHEWRQHEWRELREQRAEFYSRPHNFWQRMRFEHYYHHRCDELRAGRY